MKRRTNTGSALLMVVGLLTILAMLGATFLIIASMHNRLADSTGISAPLPDVPSGVLAQVVVLLRDGLHIDANGCYSQERTAGLSDADYFKWYTDSIDAKPVIGNAGAMLYLGVPTGEMVDVTGGGVPNAPLYATGVYNSAGQEVHAAVFVEDMSGKICVGTAADSSVGTTVTTPVKIGLKQFVGTSRYSVGSESLHRSRCKGTDRPVQDFNDDCASILGAVLGGTTNYAPFTTADEVYLRDQHLNGPSMSGRLYTALTSLTNRNLLTTYAVSRSLLRHPVTGRPTRLLLTHDALNDEATRTWLRDELVKAYGPAAGEDAEVEIIMDNTDPGAVFTGAWSTSTSNTERFGSDYRHDANSGKGTMSATYTPTIAAEGTYEVYLWWPSNAIYSAATPVQITHAGGTDSVSINQTTNGGQWNLVGEYSFTAGTTGSVTILNQGTSGHVLADGVRFFKAAVSGGGGGGETWGGEPAAIPEATVIVNNTDANAVAVGVWNEKLDATAYNGDYGHDYNADKGTKTYTFTPNLPYAGSYEVSIRWLANANRATNVPVDVVHPGGTNTVSINQQQDGSSWLVLGTFDFSAGTAGKVVIRTTGTNGYVIADAVKFYKPEEAVPWQIPDQPIIIDQDDAGASRTGTWNDKTDVAAYDGDYAHDYNADKGKTYTYTFAIQVPGIYDVDMQWLAHTNRAASVPVDITDRNGTTTVPVNQQTNGSTWNNLGSFEFEVGNATVVIRTEGTNGYVCTDAVKLTCTALPPEGGGGDPEPGPGQDTAEVDHFLANLWAYLSEDDPQTQAFKVETAYGVVPQLVITEAYAYSQPESTPGTGDHVCAYAIELMNPTDQTVKMSKYSLKCAEEDPWSMAGVADVPAGERIVLYRFFDGTGSLPVTDFFDLNVGTWYPVPDNKLDFAGANQLGTPVKIYREIGLEKIPVDSISGEDFGYTVTDKVDAGAHPDGSAVCSLGKRDDDWAAAAAGRGRGRALVATMMTTQLDATTTAKKSGHTLSSPNNLLATDLEAVHKGFYIFRGETFPADMGRILGRYLVGPNTAGEDLPHQLIAHQAADSRGRIDYKGAAPAVPTGDYPEINWSCILGELLELNSSHTEQARIYGRINLNTASAEVLRYLPYPTNVTIKDVSYTLSSTDIEAIADLIAAGRPYLSPGQVAPALIDYLVTNKLTGQEAAAGYYEARNSLYDAISNVITVNSDVFAVYIRTQVGDDADAGANYFVGIVDRSNCTATGHTPNVLIFSSLD